MRSTQYSTATLIDLFHRQTVASLPEVMAALGTRARRTAFRKLKELPYRTSYSHRGGYYTLEELIDFDQHGLWSFRAVRVLGRRHPARHRRSVGQRCVSGTIQRGVGQPASRRHPGCPAQARPAAQAAPPESCRPVFCIAPPTVPRKAQQLSARRALLAAPGLVGPVPDADLMPDQLRAAIVLFRQLAR